MTGFARFLHYASIVLTLIIVASWAMFASDEISNASKEQTAEIDGDNAPATEQQSKDDRGAVRKAIDKVADQLTSPFNGIVSATAGTWAKRTVPAALGILLYGLGLAMLARWIVTRE